LASLDTLAAAGGAVAADYRTGQNLFPREHIGLGMHDDEVPMDDRQHDVTAEVGKHYVTLEDVHSMKPPAAARTMHDTGGCVTANTRKR
jgi:hypothetical protein